MRTEKGKRYCNTLQEIISESIYYSLIAAFQSSAAIHERLKQATCYIWCSSTRVAQDTDSLLQLHRAVAVAKALSTHPALCEYVVKLSDTMKHSPLKDAILCELKKKRGGTLHKRRILPMSFGVPTLTSALVD
jgi:hypothetical protein